MGTLEADLEAGCSAGAGDARNDSRVLRGVARWRGSGRRPRQLSVRLEQGRGPGRHVHDQRTGRLGDHAGCDQVRLRAVGWRLFLVPAAHEWAVLHGLGHRHVDGRGDADWFGPGLQGDLPHRVGDDAGNDNDDHHHNDDDDDNGANDDKHHDGAVDEQHHDVVLVDDDLNHAVIHRSTLAPGGVELR